MERAHAAPGGVIVDAVWPAEGAGREAILVLAGATLIALSAQLRIVLPFSLVPITGQTFAIFLLAAAFGSRRGTATVMTYLAMGLSGLPVFSSAAPGLAALASPTAGYLMGFVPAAFLVGWLSERGASRSRWSTAGSMIAGSAVLFACGAVWLARFVGWDNVLATGVLPFLPGDALKIALATLALPAAWKLIGARGPRP
ncbi:MAG: biotin transporter BioY [Gemmatimonadaceae bacterium]|nr:biotin transporter BioY [Gemmatimonadaceae bacterium]